MTTQHTSAERFLPMSMKCWKRRCRRDARSAMVLLSRSRWPGSIKLKIPRKVIVRQFNVHIGPCACCHKRVQGRHPLQTSDALGACASQVGPDAQALAVQLNKEAGLSHGKVSRFFKAAFELDLSRSGACRVMLRVAERCQGACQAIVRQVRQSPSIVPDETGWKVGGLLAWLHVAVELIGADYDGFMTHDGWSPYMQFTNASHQTCLAHLLRRTNWSRTPVTGMRISPGGSKRFSKSPWPCATGATAAS